MTSAAPITITPKPTSRIFRVRPSLLAVRVRLDGIIGRYS
jgi:hypothetical protein